MGIELTRNCKFLAQVIKADYMLRIAREIVGNRTSLFQYVDLWPICVLSTISFLLVLPHNFFSLIKLERTQKLLRCHKCLLCKEQLSKIWILPMQIDI